MLLELRSIRPGTLLEPPDAVIMGRACNYITVAVIIHIINEYISTIRAEISRMKFPVGFGSVAWCFPPPFFNENIVSTVTIDITYTQAMAVFLCTRRVRTPGNNVHIPQAFKVIRHTEPGHLSLWANGEHQNWLTVTKQVKEQRRFIAGTVNNHSLLPVAGFVLRILIPPARLTGHPYDNRIDPSVTVYILCKVGKSLAVTFGTIVLANRTDLVHFPFWRFVPYIPRKDVYFAVMVDIPHCNSLGPESCIHNDFSKTHLALHHRNTAEKHQYY